VGVAVIVCYRPRPGMDDALLDAVREHLPVLRNEGLVTERPATAMRGRDGTIVEVFEWASQEAIGRAHELPSVQELWARFERACEYVPLADVPEAGDLFAAFEPIEL
jgi:hypothetical protein